MLKRFLIGIFCVGAGAGTGDTSTGIDLAKLGHPFLTKIRAGALHSGDQASFDEVTVTATASETILGGKGKSGRAWTVHMCASCFGEVWRADLDGNGTLDYAIFGAGPYGEARNSPPYSLSFLLMDAGGMPVPFFSIVYRGENGDGIRHLVKLDGQTGVLVSRYDEIPSDARVDAYCSGHWVTQFYKFAASAAEEVRGMVAGMRFPFVRNWAYGGPECANHPVGFSERPKILDGGTTSKGALTAKQLTECDAIAAEVVMVDTKEAREIAFPNHGDDVMERLASKVPNAELRGVHDCTATLMWGRPASP